MRQWLILIISLFLIIFFGIYEVKYLNESSSYIISDIEYCKNAINNDNFDMAKSHLKNVEETWSNLNKIWSIFVDHEEIGNIDEELLEFKIYIQQENKEDSILACNKLKRIIEHSVEKQKLSVENVF